ncbi:MAG: DNA-binding protein [Chloroflexi bacterium]|nr:DNA-binding protein [Chloroflexota bacterium]
MVERIDLDLPGALERGRIITVFGSSRARPGDPEYIAATELGRLLGERGWILCNGGYSGTMTAAAQAAKEAGGSTVGVTVTLYDEAIANPWIDRNIVTSSLFGRLEQLVELGQAYVVLKGGIGTLLELAMVWNAVQSAQAGKPVIVIGSEWGEIVRLLQIDLPMHPWEAASLTWVPTVLAAVAYLDAHFAQPGLPGLSR